MKSIGLFEKSLWSTVLLLAFGSLQAQITYRDINPDIIMNVAPESFDDIYIDIDQDNTDDIRFLLTNYPSVGLWNLGIQQEDASNPRVEILYDDQNPPSQIGDYYVKQLSPGDDIDANSMYSSDYPQVGDVYRGNFEGQGEKYIGFRIKSGASSYKYGWIKVDLSSDASGIVFTISELAYHNTDDAPIKAGEGSTIGNTEALLERAFSFFPNPAEDLITVEMKGERDIQSVRLYSVNGKLITEEALPVFPLRMDVVELKRGIYILEIEGDEFTVRKKLSKL